MKPVFAAAMLLSLLIWSVGSRAAQASPTTNAPHAISSGAFPVKVSKTLDSSKLKEGDPVEVETAGSFKLADGTLVPKGSRLSGHVTTSKSRSKGDPDSELTLSFDKLDAGGKQMAIKGTIQAVFAPVEEQAPQMAGKASGAGGGGYAASGSTMGTVTNSTVGSNTESAGKPEPTSDPKSVGVRGMRDLDLKDGVLTSKGKNVKLGGGVRMILRVEIFSE